MTVHHPCVSVAMYTSLFAPSTQPLVLNTHLWSALLTGSFTSRLHVHFLHCIMQEAVGAQASATLASLRQFSDRCYCSSYALTQLASAMNQLPMSLACQCLSACATLENATAIASACRYFRDSLRSDLAWDGAVIDTRSIRPNNSMHPLHWPFSKCRALLVSNMQINRMSGYNVPLFLSWRGRHPYHCETPALPPHRRYLAPPVWARAERPTGYYLSDEDVPARDVPVHFIVQWRGPLLAIRCGITTASCFDSFQHAARSDQDCEHVFLCAAIHVVPHELLDVVIAQDLEVGRTRHPGRWWHNSINLEMGNAPIMDQDYNSNEDCYQLGFRVELGRTGMIVDTEAEHHHARLSLAGHQMDGELSRLHERRTYIACEFRWDEQTIMDFSRVEIRFLPRVIPLRMCGCPTADNYISFCGVCSEAVHPHFRHTRDVCLVCFESVCHVHAIACTQCEGFLCSSCINAHASV